MLLSCGPEEEARPENAWASGQAAGLSKAEVARQLGIAPHTFRAWLLNRAPNFAQRAPAITAPAIPEQTPATPREMRDAAFFKRQATELAKKLADAEHLVEELAGLHHASAPPPEWQIPEDARGAGGHSALILHTSDWHMGEVVTPGEIEGINEYNPEICADRMRRLFETACTLGLRWMHGSVCDGVLLTLDGDLTSGDIHEELMRTNALTSNEQVFQVVDIAESGIRMLLQVYPRVHVVVTPGNHGRQTVKPTAKLASRLSYDIMAGTILKQRLADESRVSFTISAGMDADIPLYGRNAVVTHGDKMGTGGGQGFAGPELPIIRGAAKVRAQRASIGLRTDLILSGHYHKSTAIAGVLGNGSVVGYSEYGNQLRVAVEPAKQWMARFSHRWGLCERLDVQLSEYERPRMRFKI
jgi:transposase-like protein